MSDEMTPRSAEEKTDNVEYPGGADSAEIGKIKRSEAHRAIEAVVMCAVDPVAPGLLAELLELPVERVEAICTELARSYEEEARGFELARVAGGYRFQTHPEMAPFVERFAMEGISSRLSSAALETLAIVAYRQPVSRGQIAALRGVNVDGVVRLLVQRGLIAEVGHAPGPGQPVLYGTTSTFLEKLGLDSLSQLPPVENFLPGPEVMEELEERVKPGMPAPDVVAAHDPAADAAASKSLGTEGAPTTEEGVRSVPAEHSGAEPRPGENAANR